MARQVVLAVSANIMRVKAHTHDALSPPTSNSKASPPYTIVGSITVILTNTVKMTSEVKTIRELPLAYNEADFENSAREIVFEINHQWKTDPGPVVIHRFTEGIMNTVFSSNLSSIKHSHRSQSSSRLQRRFPDVQRQRTITKLFFYDHMAATPTS